MRTMLMSFFVLLCLLLTAFSFNYWNDSVEETQYAEVIALSQKSIITRLTSPSGKTLVPNGTILGANDIDKIEISYLVELEDNHELNVFVEEVYISKNNEIFRDEKDCLSFNFEIEKINDTQAHVKVFVRLNMPEDKEHYDYITNSTLSFNLKFNQIEI